MRGCELIEVWLIPASAASLDAERRGFVLNFSLVFLTIRLIRTVLFLPLMSGLSPWTSWPLYKPFQAELKLFCDGRITLTFFVEAYDCFSAYSHRNNVIYIIYTSEM